ncbi:class II aldolase/adducin family protein [Kiritimatiella glycovorans]|uniref:Short chain dehydrogenase n=1 Tax=Kiritimatiella glycovorans TaxID=1307763 RepID=A0A0G3EFQ7_9BACT|nr:class II aldolase/adducin family protein [Kiritimatiella glycovorans]AKJ65183.1 short chain dehydrogenase [Kiritimatiella glycovorans]
MNEEERRNLETITELSTEFGGEEYVKGGGGNTSCKNDTTLWVKPSGTTLDGMSPGTFVALDRKKVDRLHEAEPPEDASARETWVKDLMAETVLPGYEGRPSVEAPLHNEFDAVFVVHTHPPMVNGMTCAQQGEQACRKLFPDAMWCEYIDPGYTLCTVLRERIGEWKREQGAETRLIFLQNHGVFIAGDSAEEIREQYGKVMQALRGEIESAEIAPELDEREADEQACDKAADRIREALGDDAAGLARGGVFAAPGGPISPDHIVYAKSFPLIGRCTPEAAETFRKEYGYAPRVISEEPAVFGAGPSQKVAGRALELARDGALIVQYAQAFGGIRYMDDRAREFIENWEVEAYRSKVAEGNG